MTERRSQLHDGERTAAANESHDLDDAVLDRAQLISAIEGAEARVREMDAERSAEIARIEALKATLEAHDARSRVAREPRRLPLARRAPRSGAEKLQIFRELFRGRLDVYPTRFVSKRTGTAGYAPACRNKFVAGTCELPKVKCGECTNQAFFPVDDDAILAHLRGRHVMGVYPMLPDDTCWLLAVDFDKSTWTEDVRAFVATSRRLGLPCAVERSRSGNGAHVWFFFSSPVAASDARKLGCYLITETMSDRHELSMESYESPVPEPGHDAQGRLR